MSLLYCYSLVALSSFHITNFFFCRPFYVDSFLLPVCKAPPPHQAFVCLEVRRNSRRFDITIQLVYQRITCHTHIHKSRGLNLGKKKGEMTGFYLRSKDACWPGYWIEWFRLGGTNYVATEKVFLKKDQEYI